MSKRKFFLLNPVNYRIKKIFVIISGILLCNIIVLIVAASFISSTSNGSNDPIHALEETVKIENNIIDSFLVVSEKHDSKGLILASDKIKKDHEEGMRMIQQHIEDLKAQSERDRRFLYSTIALIAVLTLGMYMLTVYVFSRMSGPVHLMAEKMKAVLNGEEPEFRPLRDGDELKEFYADFIKMVENKR